MNKKLLFLLILILILIAFFYHLATFNHGINVLDEGLLLHGTERMIEGEVQFKDFVTLYPPGKYLLLTLFFKIFGQTILALKFMKLFFLLAIVPVIYLLSKKIIKDDIFSLFPPLLIIFYSPTTAFSRYFFALLSILVLFLLYEKRSKFWTFIPGLLIGLAILFSHEVGIFAFIACMIFIVLSQSFRLYNFKKLAKEVFLLSLGSLIIILPFLFYFYQKSALSFLGYYLFYYPFKIYPIHNSIPYPSILAGLPNIIFWIFREGLVFYIPILVYFSMAMYLFLKIFKIKKITKNINFLLTLTIFGLLVFKTVQVRSDLPHLYYTLMIVYILGLFLLKNLYSFIKTNNKTKNYAFLLLVLLLPTLFILQWPVYRVLYQPNQNDIFLNLPKTQVYEEETKANAIKEIVNYINTHTKEDDYIFVIPYEAAFYFLTERKNPTQYNVFLPGESNEKIQKELIKKIEKANVSYVIYGHGWKVDGKDFKDYALPIHEYVYSNYHLEKQISHYEILKKNTP